MSSASSRVLESALRAWLWQVGTRAWCEICVCSDVTTRFFFDDLPPRRVDASARFECVCESQSHMVRLVTRCHLYHGTSSMPISSQRLVRRGHFRDAHGMPRAEPRAARQARARCEPRAHLGVEDDTVRRPRQARARRRAIVRFARIIIHSRARARSSPRADRHPAHLRHRQAVRRRRVGR